MTLAFPNSAPVYPFPKPVTLKIFNCTPNTDNLYPILCIANEIRFSLPKCIILDIPVAATTRLGLSAPPEARFGSAPSEERKCEICPLAVWVVLANRPCLVF
jgi:hypothetical protein